tara:strand:+ start:14354 stop:14875 length:522 start_codon:yes stop_codon:yes gene_type:complete
MRKLILISIILFSVNLAFSQNWRLRSNCYVTTSSDLPLRYIEGISFSGFYSYRFKPDTSILLVNQVYGGLSFSTNSWANHLLAKIGFSPHIKSWKKWSSNADIEIGNGIALFKPKPLYTIDFQSTVYMNYHTLKDNLWGIGLGIQYISTPGYKKYTTIEQFEPNMLLSLRYAF